MNFQTYTISSVIRKITLLIISVFLLLTSSLQPVLAADLPRLIIMGEDENPDTIPRGSQIFKRVMGRFANALINEGFSVYEERAILDDTGDRRRRPVEELVDNGKDAGADVIVLFTIYGYIQDIGYTKKITTRVEGRLLDVQSNGKRLGNFEVHSPKAQRLSEYCERDCILEKAGELAATLGQDVASVLRDKLVSYVDRSGGRVVEYTLVFDNFSTNQMMAFEEYLEIFSGYVSHRPASNGLNTSTHHEYWYNSSINTAKLRRNLNKALNKLNLNGRITFADNKFEITRIGAIKNRTENEKDEW